MSENSSLLMNFFILSTYGSCGCLYSRIFFIPFSSCYRRYSIPGIFFIPCSSCYVWLPLFQGFFYSLFLALWTLQLWAFLFRISRRCTIMLHASTCGDRAQDGAHGGLWNYYAQNSLHVYNIYIYIHFIYHLVTRTSQSVIEQARSSADQFPRMSRFYSTC
jgi:hypothetical protein